MGFAPNQYPYMPPGSYAIMPDGKIVYLKPVPDDLKKQFERDVEAAIKTARNQSQTYTNDYYY